MAQIDLNTKLQEGIRLAKANQFMEAEAVFDRLLGEYPKYQEALIWKAAISNDPAVSVACLEKVLREDPHNQRAKAGLEWARQRLQQAYFSQNNRTTENSQHILTSSSQKTAENAAPVETIAETKAYNKSRLEPNQTKVGQDNRSFFNPTTAEKEAVSPTAKKAAQNRPETRKTKTPDSEVMRAAMPRIKLRVSEQVAQMAQADYDEAHALPQRLVISPVWAFGLFAGAIFLAMLSFVVSGLSPILGVTALILAVLGVGVFNQTTGRN